MKHRPTKNLNFCVKCGQSWPCMISVGTDAVLKVARKEITKEQASARVLHNEQRLLRDMKKKVKEIADKVNRMKPSCNCYWHFDPPSSRPLCPVHSKMKEDPDIVRL